MQTLIKASEYFNNKQNKELGAIYASTKGVVFFGTPHRGSPQTGLAQIVANVAKITLRRPNEKLVRNLSEDSDVLERQRRSFASIAEQLSLVCLWEELPTGVGVVSLPTSPKEALANSSQIVSETSACIDGFNVRTNSIPKNHMDMCKFQDVNELGFKRAYGHIARLVPNDIDQGIAREFFKYL